MDKIILKGLTFRAKHGVLPYEKEFPQTFIVDAKLFLEQPCTARDELAGTVNYAKVSDFIAGIVQGESFSLIECMAVRLCEGLLERFSKLCGVRITVKKPMAPIDCKCDYAAVCVERGRVQ